jgi:ubiquinone/menaquinone biosynthesis C-methylase UbiE
MSSWGFWSWLFYVIIPATFIILGLLKAYCPPFENWWYTHVSIKIFGSGGHSLSGHGHSHGGGQGHSHGQHQLSEELISQIDEVKRTLFKDLNKIVSKSPELKKDGSIRILEIGTGRGANFQYFPDKCNLIALDAHDGFKSDLMDNMKKHPGIHLEKFVHAGAENMEEIQDSSVDVVIGTAVFCQVKNMQKVLSEVKRVLVPGGRFFYIEHIGAEPNSWTLFFQKLVTKSGLLPLLAGGYLDRHMDLDILKTGFSEVKQKYFQINHKGHGWSWKSWMMQLARRNVVGVATK